MTDVERRPDGSATAKAIDYSPKRWVALTRYIDDRELAADNNRIQNRGSNFSRRQHTRSSDYCPR